MGNKKRKYIEKILRQKINKQENKAYYQNASDWHSPSTDREISDRRKLSE
jgi:hypothetical protein